MALTKPQQTFKEYPLRVIHDSAKSFYKKAYVQESEDLKSLKSYNTIVAQVEYKDGYKHLQVFGTHSSTTLRHIKEFLAQEGFKGFSKSDIDFMMAHGGLIA